MSFKQKTGLPKLQFDMWTHFIEDLFILEIFQTSLRFAHSTRGARPIPCCLHSTDTWCALIGILRKLHSSKHWKYLDSACIENHFQISIKDPGNSYSAAFTSTKQWSQKINPSHGFCFRTLRRSNHGNKLGANLMEVGHKWWQIDDAGTKEIRESLPLNL